MVLTPNEADLLFSAFEFTYANCKMYFLKENTTMQEAQEAARKYFTKFCEINDIMGIMIDYNDEC